MLLAAGEGTCRAERSERACRVTGRKACGAGSIQYLRPANKHTAALFLLLQSAGSGKILEVSALTVQDSKFDLSQLVCRKQFPSITVSLKLMSISVSIIIIIIIIAKVLFSTYLYLTESSVLLVSEAASCAAPQVCGGVLPEYFLCLEL